MRNTLFVVAMLGTVLVGTNSASAATVNDSTGNPLKYGKYYYMEGLNYPGKGITYGSWNLGKWAYLDPAQRGQAIKIEPRYDAAHNGDDVQENHTVAIQMDTTNPQSSYLRIHGTYNGIQLGNYSLSTSLWSIQKSPDGFVTFRNKESYKYMEYTEPNAWLDATQFELTGFNKWRLIEK
ncbi:hypothetical protein [Bacillus cereus]|uniref:hypothetical protein n=1 Tax=Bacillus cereus TaxID=1396 RepID=UPI000BEC1015|nr:hypothetical protein [Bacillus cereus]PEA06506.1 hypothetical protein CON37_01200 [Bacillus cereus]